MILATKVSVMGKEITKEFLFWNLWLPMNCYNSFFKKKKEHLVTYKSGFIKTQIDYFLIRVNNRRLCNDYKVISHEYLGILLRKEFGADRGCRYNVGCNGRMYLKGG